MNKKRIEKFVSYLFATVFLAIICYMLVVIELYWYSNEFEINILKSSSLREFVIVTIVVFVIVTISWLLRKIVRARKAGRSVGDGDVFK